MCTERIATGSGFRPPAAPPVHMKVECPPPPPPGRNSILFSGVYRCLECVVTGTALTISFSKPTTVSEFVCLRYHKFILPSHIYCSAFCRSNLLLLLDLNLNSHWPPSGSRPMIVYNIKLIHQWEGGLHKHDTHTHIHPRVFIVVQISFDLKKKNFNAKFTVKIKKSDYPNPGFY